MAMLDLSWLSYYITIFGFLFVFTIMLAILSKTKILGDSSNWANILVSLVFAIVFVTFSPGVEYVQTIIPWFVILIIALFFVLIIVGFSQKKMDDFMKPGLGWVFIILLAIVFIVAAIKVFNPIFVQFLPGTASSASGIKSFFYSERFLGGALLLIIAAAAAWVLTKKVK
ncbi:MAG: hypothetical protein WC796_01640 [Candidatus Pacearchaeota archaeon]|jgi:hypothetical protein